MLRSFKKDKGHEASAPSVTRDGGQDDQHSATVLNENNLGPGRRPSHE